MNSKASIRNAYGNALLALGATREDMVVLDADLSTSTKTSMFAKKYPERFFNIGIAEQNMMGIAAGMALDGRIVFASTFAVFGAGRAYDQVRQSIAYPKLNVKIVVTHGGITVGGDGASHQMIEDIGLMYGLPNMNILVPVDANETYNAILSIADINGPFYVRLTRMDPYLLTESTTKFDLMDVPLLREGDDIAIVSTGHVASRALEAAEILKKEGVSTAVYNLHTIKPLNKTKIIEIAKKYGAIVTVEEHNVNTGIGSVISGILAEEYPAYVIKTGIHDVFGESGEPDKLLDKYGISIKDIVNAVKKAIEKRDKK
ncbi:MAG: transketolase family protein [Thermoplasmata archaeon]